MKIKDQNEPNKMQGILFKTPMVQQILAGRKTMTRRLIKEAKGWDHNWKVSPINEEYIDGIQRYEMRCSTQYHLPFFKSKYQVGDILYVRETWQTVKYAPPCSAELQDIYVYKADGGSVGEYDITKWKPSLFMPKEAARIFLQVTGVRAERLQEISMHDAIAEGIEDEGKYDFRDYSSKKGSAFMNPIHSFRTLWDSINAKTSPWDKNEWVWVYSFNKIEKP